MKSNEATNATGVRSNVAQMPLNKEQQAMVVEVLEDVEGIAAQIGRKKEEPTKDQMFSEGSFAVIRAVHTWNRTLGKPFPV